MTDASDSNVPHKPTNFLRGIIDRDLEQGTYASRRWAGSPGDAAHHEAGQPDPAKIRTRFPPEPNGYLHVGHAKSICLNFGLARDYGGVCHMRFDDTNPEKEEQEYVDAILDAVKWLGFGWESNFNGQPETHLYYASNYFDFMYRAAEALITAGLAYVDEQTPEEMRVNRGDFSTPGKDSPFRARTPDENLARFREMRDGKHPDGSMVLRAKIDMASPNINMRDPAIYRIRRATHHNTGDKWCIYPMYTFAHPIEDALEQITHSICTLEFEDQRPFYDWLVDNLAKLGLLKHPNPKQHEFARLNLTYVITSKRKLKQLVDEGVVSGWDDPRMPTIAGLRRRGYTPEAIQLFCERIGVSKSDSWIDYSTLDIALRDDLENKAHRGMAVLDPVKLVLTNWDEVFSAGHLEACSLPALPHPPEGTESPVRHFKLGREVWIEREDFEEVPPKGYKRLFPGNKVRLKGGYVIECTGCTKDAEGKVTEVLATVVPDTKSGTPGADSVKVKAAITWVGAADGVEAEVRLYDRLFTDPQPDAGGKDFKASLNPESFKVVKGYVEPSLAVAAPDQKFQFERFGYFVADRVDHAPGKPVFNKITGLKDSWSNFPAPANKGISGEEETILSDFISRLPKFHLPSLVVDRNPVGQSEKIIEVFGSRPLYVQPSLKVVERGGGTSAIAIVRASGAVGKSELGRYIASMTGGIYWNLALQQLGHSSFVGAFDDGFGTENFSAIVKAVQEGKVTLVIDAFDEAEIREGVDRVELFLDELAARVAQVNRVSVVLLARVESANFVHSYLSASSALKSAVPMYELAYFNEEQACEFVSKVAKSGFSKAVQSDVVKSIGDSFAAVLGIKRDSAWGDGAFRGFMGYAPVLQSIAALIDEKSNLAQLVQSLRANGIADRSGVVLLNRIFQALLLREQQKFISRIKEVFPDRLVDQVKWEGFYSPSEQLRRLAAKFFDVGAYRPEVMADLPPQYERQYQQAVEQFLEMHPFVRAGGYAGPAFRDYLYAWALTNDEFCDFADHDIKSRGASLTPLLFMFVRSYGYSIGSEHVVHLLESFSAGSTDVGGALIVVTDLGGVALFGKETSWKDPVTIEIAVRKPGVVLGSRVRNVTVHADVDVVVGNGVNVELSNSLISCRSLVVRSSAIYIRRDDKSDFGVVINAKEKIDSPDDILLGGRGLEQLIVLPPADGEWSYPWRKFAVVLNALRVGGVGAANLNRSFVELSRIMRWFRKDKREDLAKHRELIDNVVIGDDPIRKALMDFLKERGVIQIRGPLYIMQASDANKCGLVWGQLRSGAPSDTLRNFLVDFVASRPDVFVKSKLS